MKRWLSLALTVCMLLTILPAPALAGALVAVEHTTYESTASEQPTEAPTAEPTTEPTEAPTAEPTAAPTEAPTAEPTTEPTEAPTAEPTTEPTEAPTAEPTTEPTEAPTAQPPQVNLLGVDEMVGVESYSVIEDDDGYWSYDTETKMLTIKLDGYIATNAMPEALSIYSIEKVILEENATIEFYDTAMFNSGLREIELKEHNAAIHIMTELNPEERVTVKSNHSLDYNSYSDIYYNISNFEFTGTGSVSMFNNSTISSCILNVPVDNNGNNTIAADCTFGENADISKFTGTIKRMATIYPGGGSASEQIEVGHKDGITSTLSAYGTGTWMRMVDGAPVEVGRAMRSALTTSCSRGSAMAAACSATRCTSWRAALLLQRTCLRA